MVSLSRSTNRTPRTYGTAAISFLITIGFLAGCWTTMTLGTSRQLDSLYSSTTFELSTPQVETELSQPAPQSQPEPKPESKPEPVPQVEPIEQEDVTVAKVVDQEELNRINKRTGVVVFTHLISEHPSLDPLLTILNSVQTYIKGLPEKAPLFITVDGIKDLLPEERKGELFQLESKENREKYDQYLVALNTHFADQENVRILVAGRNIGLANNIRRVLDNVSKDTEYMYIIQHDLPFTKDVNHTDILVTADAHDDMRLVGFPPERRMGGACGEPIISPSGRVYRRHKLWTDRNHFVRVSHYVNDILPMIISNFPEDNMHRPARRNCTYFGPHYYDGGQGGPFYDHTDASGRYGEKLAERVRKGELDFSRLTDVNILVMKRLGVNVTELEEIGKKAAEEKGETRQKN